MNKYIFLLLVGRMPEQDDLDRVNCKDAGTVFHSSCGFCWRHRKPVYECFCKSCRNQKLRPITTGNPLQIKTDKHGR